MTTPPRDPRGEATPSLKLQHCIEVADNDGWHIAAEQARAELAALTAAAASARALAIEEAAKVCDGRVGALESVVRTNSTIARSCASRAAEAAHIAARIRALSPQRAAGSEAT